MTKLASIALATVTLGSVASANVVASEPGYSTPPSIRYDEPREDRDSEPSLRRIEGRFGMLLGGSDVGDADGFSTGVSAGLGYRIGDVTLRGLFDYFRVGDGEHEGMGRRGRSTRVGGALRYSFANTGYADEGAHADFWGEVGFGYEHVAWNSGGVLDRPSGELAIGYELDLAGENRHGKQRHIGYFMAFRTLLARGPEMDGPATCGGPCTQATRPSRIDASMFFEVGLHWGR